MAWGVVRGVPITFNLAGLELHGRIDEVTMYTAGPKRYQAEFDVRLEDLPPELEGHARFVADAAYAAFDELVIRRRRW